jgi:hypothetical protein
MINDDMLYDMIYNAVVWYMVIWYYMIWYNVMVWYYIIWYMLWLDVIYLLTEIGLTSGGSGTVHIYKQTIQRKTESK